MRLLFVFYLLIATLVTAKAAVPRDFRVAIEDHAGLGEGNSFDTTISADGTVHQRVLLHDGWQYKRAVISQPAVSQLFDVVQKERFFSLAANYPTDAFDCDTFVITIHANGRSHRVRSATCSISRGTKAEWNRFFRVWAAALRAYPSPNRDEKPEDFER